MTFLAKTSSPSEWKIVVAAVQALVEEASFEATAEALTFRAMDPSRVALIDLNWPNSAFEKYDCDAQYRFAVRVEDFVKLIKRADAKDSIEITMADNESLSIKMEDGYKKEFKIHLIESTYSPTPLPRLSFNTKAVVLADTFEKALNDVSALSDHVTMESAGDRLVLSGKSDMGSASISLEKGEEVLEIDVKENSKATYVSEYLTNIMKVATGAETNIIIEYSSKMPLRLEFKLSESGGRVHFYLAPRIEES